MTTDAVAAVARRYDRFAREEAPGRSALYERWAAEVAADAEACAVLGRIAPEHRQPVLVFAVARRLGAGDAGDLSGWIAGHADALVAECSQRSIQTNEPRRCTALLPALSLIDGPIALLELGASAGLCLYPDRYRYEYFTTRGVLTAVDPPDAPVDAPVLSCTVRGGQMPELRIPEIVWRAGVDTHPLDVRQPADRAWLEGLLWPDETARRDRLRAALDVAAADPPLLVAADAADGCRALAERAPADATLVVTTPGMLIHVDASHRPAVIAAARSAGRWITIDHRELHEGWGPRQAFALGLDGVALADVDPLGAWLVWRDEDGDAAD